MASAIDGLNGNRILYWIMGALLMILVAVSGAGGAWFNARLTDVEQTQRQRGDRVIALESKVETLKDQLKRMEDKIDRLLERRP